MKSILFGSIAALLYIYIGYPAIVAVLSRLRPRRPKAAAIEPAATVLIAAHNEEGPIAATLENKLALDYPREKLEIVVISDGSMDRTCEIVEAFAERGVRLLRQEPRAGKTSALNMGAREARGEILVFSDANSLYDAQALRHLASHFADPEIGYVTGKMVYVRRDRGAASEGCSAYMRYENVLRAAETRLGSIVGVDGGIDAVRRSLYEPMRADQLPDFVLPLSVVQRGYRVVYEPRAVLREHALERAGDEYRMRVRVALRALWALRDERALLNPFRFPIFAWQLWSHKVLRYAAFVLLVATFASNAALAGEGAGYRALLAVQALGYGAAAAGMLLERLGWSVRALHWPYYFALINVAAAHASVKFLMGRRQVLWVPRKG